MLILLVFSCHSSLMIVVYLAVIHSIFYIVKNCDNLFEECAMILYMNIRSVSACLSVE